MLFVSLKGSKKASIMYKSLLGLKCTVNKNRVREKLLNLSIIFEEKSELSQVDLKELLKHKMAIL